MISNIIQLLLGIGVILFLKTGMGQTNRAQEDDRTPMSRPIGRLIGSILGYGIGGVLAIDAITKMVYINKGMGIIVSVIEALVTQSLF